jgi:hypothetical protein
VPCFVASAARKTMILRGVPVTISQSRLRSICRMFVRCWTYSTLRGFSCVPLPCRAKERIHEKQ